MSDALFVDTLTKLEKSIVISLLLAPVGKAPKVKSVVRNVIVRLFIS